MISLRLLTFPLPFLLLLLLTFLLRPLPTPFLLLHRIVLPHDKPVPPVELPRACCQIRILVPQPAQPCARHLLPPRTRLHPHLVEVASTAVILGDAHSVGHVEDGVPPPVGYKYGLAGVLREFVAFKVRIIAAAALLPALPGRRRGPSFQPGKYCREVMDRLVVLPRQGQPASLHHALGHVGREEHPSLHAVHERVPRARSQRIYVYRRTGSARSHQEPTVRRPPTLADQP
mmetsp:Transcript_15328/g.36747  ORF Transcript_15328/g.36747 Transcript_15328/m.36747 type:complete len:231 (-) Transcript_15328:163-855(-)